MNSIFIFHNTLSHCSLEKNFYHLERLSPKVTLFRMSFVHSSYVLNAYYVIEVTKLHLFTAPLIP